MNQYLTTTKFAESLGVQGDSVRRALCVRGAYLGVRPVKLPNGRLMWPAVARDRLLRGENPESEG